MMIEPADVEAASADYAEPEVRPLGRYARSVLIGDALWVSGHTSRDPHGHVTSGVLGDDLDVAQGRAAAQIAAKNVVDAAIAMVGEMPTRAVSVRVYIRSTPKFELHSEVANGASEIIDSFAAGPHARCAIGVSSLPGGAAVEVEASFVVLTQNEQGGCKC